MAAPKDNNELIPSTSHVARCSYSMYRKRRLSSAPKKLAMTPAERQRLHRARQKAVKERELENNFGKKLAMTPAERQRLYRARKKAAKERELQNRLHANDKYSNLCLDYHDGTELLRNFTIKLTTMKKSKSRLQRLNLFKENKQTSNISTANAAGNEQSQSCTPSNVRQKQHEENTRRLNSANEEYVLGC